MEIYEIVIIGHHYQSPQKKDLDSPSPSIVFPDKNGIMFQWALALLYGVYILLVEALSIINQSGISLKSVWQ